MTKKIIFFTAGPSPTSNESSAIQALNAMAAPAYEVNVSNGSVSHGLGSGKIEACDYVAGTVPSAYSAKAVFNASEPPPSDATPSTSTIISSGQKLSLDGKEYTFTVSAKAITAISVKDEE